MAARSNHVCRIEVLGTLRLVLGGETLTHFPRQKAARLLTYLALHPKQAHPREHLIDLFWPDLDLPAGRDSLSTTLSALRRLLGLFDVLVTTHQTVGLRWDRVTTDAAEFERLLGAASREVSVEKRRELLAEAAALYRGEACAGFYDDWAVREGERLHSVFAGALRSLTLALEQLGNTEEARRRAEEWTAADLYNEEAHLHLIALHVRAGQGSEARAAAKKLKHLWREEFGASLSPEVEANIAAALTQNTPKAVPLQIASILAPLVPLPVPLDTFFGREQERAWLEDWLTADKARLVTLVGPGGMGKTRLALDFAARAGHFTPHLVPLSETEDPAQILPAVVRALALPSGHGPLPQLAAFFETLPRPLLILDNLEQLISGREGEAAQEGKAAREIQSLLLAAPNLTCLCTSRLPLLLRGERLLPVQPLSLPPPGGGDAMQTHASVQLYVDRARAVRPDFSLTLENASAVAAVCRLLDGSPLALELAASWVRLLPPRAMWERLTRQSGRSAGISALETRRPDVPARHHSLRAALDWSWRLLKPAEQRLLRQVSVFRGGWTLEAAEAVCGEPDSLALLSSLLQASLVRVSEEKNGEARYSLLETVRQYAREQLEDAGDLDGCRARHTDYFLSLTLAAKLDGPAQVPELNRLETEHDNLRAALDHCRDDPASAEKGLTLAAALLPFWRARSYLKEGEERTLALLQSPLAAGPTAARASALNCAGMLAMLQAAYDRAAAYHKEAREIFCTLEDAGGEAAALHGLGNVAHFNQDYPAARTLFEAALARRQPGDTAGLAASWHSLGGLALREGSHAAAMDCYARALCLRRRLGDTLGVAGTLGGLGQVALAQHDLAGAAEHTRECLRLFHAAGQRWTASLCLDVLSRIAFALGQPEREIRLLAAALTVRERSGFAVPPAERDAKQKHVTEMRVLLGDAVFEAAWAEGQALTWDEAAAYALTDAPV